MSQKAGADD